MKIITIKISTFIKNEHIFNSYFDLLYNSLHELKNDYPNFKTWYYKKVKLGILKGNREIIFKVLDNNVAGLVILKKTKFEKKISTLRVGRKYQRNGIGKSLILDAINYLEIERPLITVSSVKDYQFNKLFEYLGFEKDSELMNYYVLRQKEITYNGSLSPIRRIIRKSFSYEKLNLFLEKWGLKKSLEKIRTIDIGHGTADYSFDNFKHKTTTDIRYRSSSFDYFRRKIDIIHETTN